MTLLAFDDPVFVIDLTADLGVGPDPRAPPAESEPAAGPAPLQPQDAPIRAVALLVHPDEDPVLLEIAPPTRDTRMLDAFARLLRVAVHAAAPLATVAAAGDDALIAELWRARVFPGFAYSGPPAHLTPLLPAAVRAALCPASPAGAPGVQE